MPRQFLGLAPSARADTDDVSNSSSGERTQSETPPINNVEAGSKSSGKVEMAAASSFDQENSSFRDGKRIGREESPESESQGWGPNKSQKLSSPGKSIDQSTEASMKKARVSVRARSEAPMVCAGNRPREN